jgi:hypothetical protein
VSALRTGLPGLHLSVLLMSETVVIYTCSEHVRLVSRPPHQLLKLGPPFPHHVGVDFSLSGLAVKRIRSGFPSPVDFDVEDALDYAAVGWICDEQFAGNTTHLHRLVPVEIVHAAVVWLLCCSLNDSCHHAKL